MRQAIFEVCMLLLALIPLLGCGDGDLPEQPLRPPLHVYTSSNASIFVAVEAKKAMRIVNQEHDKELFQPYGWSASPQAGECDYVLIVAAESDRVAREHCGFRVEISEHPDAYGDDGAEEHLRAVFEDIAGEL